MPSFTSSFERAPQFRWGIIVMILVLVTSSLIASTELFWRTRGAEQDYFDDLRRWAFFRDQVESLTNPNSTVLLGASRIQLGWSMDAFRSMLPETSIIQLAIDGTHPFAVLRDLSDNTKFSGVVVVALTAGGILPAARDAAQSHVDFYTNSWTLNNKFNFLVDDFFQQYLVVRQPLYGFKQTIVSLLKGKPDFNYLETTRERERNANYQRLDINVHRAERIRRKMVAAEDFQPPTIAEWDDSVTKLDQIVRPMVQRGARVVFIRFPTSDEHWTIDQDLLPRANYWDDMANKVAGDWIHFEDVVGVDQFDLPDTSHLDQRDKAEFTRIIIGRLQELGVY